MTVSAVHQFVPVGEPGGVGNHVVELQRMIRTELQLASEIFVAQASPRFEARTKPFRSYATSTQARPDDVLIYHVAIGSDVGDFVRERPQRLVINYHNLTPVRYFEAWEPKASHGLAWGRRQLAELAPRCQLAIAVSRYNERDLVGSGYRATTVAPLLVDYQRRGSTSDPITEKRLAAAKEEGGADWLFVGRVSPNKCQHQVIRAFAAYRALYDPRARLHLVGGSSSPSYYDTLGRYIEALGLRDAVRLTEWVTQPELVAHYRQADVFVCLSEHEGFCIPLIEAMWHGLPVVALGSSAVAGTVGDAAVVLPFVDHRQPDAATVAAAVARVLDGGNLRKRLVAAGWARADQFSLARTRRSNLQALELVR